MDNNFSKFVQPGRNKVINGNISSPESTGLSLVFVPCGMTGKPDSDLHKLLNKKWRTVESDIKGWYTDQFTFKLGAVKDRAVQSDVWLLYSVVKDKEGKTDKKALEECVKKIAAMCKSEKASLHVSALTTEDMPELGKMLVDKLVKQGTSVFFYTEAKTQ